MALHDFACPDCGTLLRDVHVPVTIGASHASIACPCCELDLDRLVWMAPCIAVPRLSLFSDSDPRGGSHDFTKFTTEVEDPSSPTGYRQATIGSLADIRRLERESEQRERNGEGRKYVWRDYAQDRSNTDQHSFMADPSMKPSKAYLNQTPVTVRRGDPVTADHGTLPGGEA